MREVARRYAEALYQVAVEDGAVEATADELRTVVARLEEIRELGQFLAHPLISRGKKTTLIGEVFPELSDRTKNLLTLVIHNRREIYLDLIHEEFTEVRVHAEGLAKAVVRTAKPMTEEERGRIKARLEEALHRKVQLDERVNEELLGGVRIELDGRVLDGTLQARLGKLRAAMGE